MLNNHNLTAEERQIYNQGAEDARRFQQNQGAIYQNIFKAETNDFRFHVGFDDVDLGVYLSVTFKRHFTKDGHPKEAMVSCGTARKAIARVMAFLDRHAPDEPYCDVDY